MNMRGVIAPHILFYTLLRESKLDMLFSSRTRAVAKSKFLSSRTGVVRIIDWASITAF